MLLRKIALTLNFKFLKQTSNQQPATSNQQQANHRAQNIIRKFIVLVILVLSCTNCQVDEQVLKSNEAHNGPDKGKISFKQFATETGTLHFKTVLAIHNNNKIDSKSINEFSEFYIDTIAIRKLISKNQKATYTFRIYPLFKKNEPNEFYNLVYHKVNDSWTTSVFLLKKNLNTNNNNRPFETIEKITSQLKVPNKTQKTAAECFQFYIEIRCDGSCPGACDGLKCEKGVCYFIGIAQVGCGGGFQTSTTPINYPNTDNNNTGGGSNTDFVFNPNTLKNLDINDPNYVNLWNTTNVWTDLDGPEILFFRYDAQNMIFFDATIQYQIDNNWSSESAVIANSLRKAKFENPDSNFDVEASFKSPFNIDKSSIKDVTEEDKKFNKLYDALKTSPEFKKLFIDLFDGDKSRINVKFEIADRVYEDNDTSKPEVNATTSEDPVTKNLTIKISKQILIAGTTKSQTNIENAKTILHECIHAYLFSKAANASVGATFVETLNIKYSTPNEQHDFMYGKMIPTMQKVLGEVRDLVTTEPKRTILEAYTMHPTTNPLTSTSFNWLDFYKNLSLSGLNDTSGFKQDLPNPSDALRLHQNYIDAGKNELDR